MKLDYSIISKNRTKIMGLAIISIIIFHYFDDVVIFGINNNYIMKIANIYRKYIASIGVDIFFIVSAVGLYFSYNKNKDLKVFYNKRIKRVLIPYIIICGTYYFIFDVIIKKLGILNFVKDFLWITFFTKHNTTFWYIFAILLLYLFFPYINEFINNGKKERKRLIIAIFVVIIINIGIMLINRELYNNIEIFITRIPIFIYGIYFAKKVYNKEKLNKKIIIMNIVCIIVVLIMKLISYKYYSIYKLVSRYLISLLAINVTMIISLYFNFSKLEIVDNFFEKMGKYTLELYIFHICYREIFNYYKLYTSNIKYEMIMIFISICSSVIFNFLYARILDYLNNRTKKVT